MRDGKVKTFAAVLALGLALSACAAYTTRPLPPGPDLAPTPVRLTTDVSKLRLGPLKAHRFDPSDGLDPTEVAILAVLNSPDLQAKRAAAKVSAAQAFSASLLPDPQVNVSLDFPVNPSAGYATAYNVAPNLDLMALITHAAALKSAKASATQADLDLLWSEWNTAQQARQLAVTAMANERKAEVLKRLADQLADRYAQSQAAMRQGDLAASAVSADLAAEADAQAALASALHDAAKTRGDLNALIGLSPAAQLDLRPGGPIVDPEPTALDTAIAALPTRRPDLLALQAGYQAQSANLRKAILSQFPVVNLGFSHAADTSAVLTNGLSATFVVPIFNRGRGEIAVQSATQEQLRAEYQARLDQTVADAAAARREREAARREVERLRLEVPRLRAMADQGAAALHRGDLDSGAYMALEQSALNHEVALLDQELAFELADVSLETVLFLPSDPGA